MIMPFMSSLTVAASIIKRHTYTHTQNPQTKPQTHTKTHQTQASRRCSHLYGQGGTLSRYRQQRPGGGARFYPPEGRREMWGVCVCKIIPVDPEEVELAFLSFL